VLLAIGSCAYRRRTRHTIGPSLYAVIIVVLGVMSALGEELTRNKKILIGSASLSRSEGSHANIRFK
jgi:hypothetical protein